MLTNSLIRIKINSVDIQIAGSIICGFPSPGWERRDEPLDFNELLVRHPSSTYCLRAAGESMQPLIYAGDILIADRSLLPRDGDIIIAEIDGMFTAKRLCTRHGVRLLAENPLFSPISITSELISFGVVTAIVRQCRRQ